MQNKAYVQFTEEMKKDYTILVPDMLPIHFKLISSVMKTYGYNMELLTNTGSNVVEAGLKYTHNDTCYPAILVIGQFMDALMSGKYDLNKTALIMFQTGGGCRASNYISLIRKALKNAGLEHIPVISLSLSGLEKHSGFKLNLKIMMRMLYGALYGDLLMSLVNQIRPYEKCSGDAEHLADSWTQKLAVDMVSDGGTSFKKIKENCRLIVKDFSQISVSERDCVKVGIVGEIFVKYSPLANNDLERLLISEGAEPIVPGLWDFCLYCIYNMIAEYGVYKKKNPLYLALKGIYNSLCKKKNDISDIMSKSGRFRPWTPFEKVTKIAKDIISTSVKMGEGWLLTSEMLELAEMGCENIVCTQPFGCLPNHICGKGMMKPLKEKNPNINIVAIDYDAGASRVNQENRIKLMLFNARKIKEKKEKTYQAQKN